MKESQDEEERKRRDLEAKENEDNKDDEDDEDADEEEHTLSDNDVSITILCTWFMFYFQILRLNLRMMFMFSLISTDEKKLEFLVSEFKHSNRFFRFCRSMMLIALFLVYFAGAWRIVNKCVACGHKHRLYSRSYVVATRTKFSHRHKIVI